MARPNSGKYAKMFPDCTTKGKAIKNIQVREMDKIAAMKIVVTLWDETSITSSLPGWFCASENKDFIFYYVDEDPLSQAAIDKILDQLIGNISLNELEELARNVNWAMSVAVCKAGSYCKETSAYMVSIGVNIGVSKFYKHGKNTYRLNLSEEVGIFYSNSDSSAEISVEALDKAYLSLMREFKHLASFKDMFHMDDHECSSNLTEGFVDDFVITEFGCASYDGV